jgi:hypothetical protein
MASMHYKAFIRRISCRPVSFVQWDIPCPNLSYTVWALRLDLSSHNCSDIPFQAGMELLLRQYMFTG